MLRTTGKSRPLRPRIWHHASFDDFEEGNRYGWAETAVLVEGLALCISSAVLMGSLARSDELLSCLLCLSCDHSNQRRPVNRRKHSSLRNPSIQTLILLARALSRTCRKSDCLDIADFYPRRLRPLWIDPVSDPLIILAS